MPETEIEIVLLLQSNGRSQVEDWLTGIRDKSTHAKIDRQIDKLTRGAGNQKGLKGVTELKIDLGPGYRVYYAFLDNKSIVLLIWAGDKSDQQKDIASAREMLKAFEKNGQRDVALRKWKEEQNERNEVKEL